MADDADVARAPTRVSTGKLKRPSNQAAQPPRSSLKRKSTDARNEAETAVKRSRNAGQAPPRPAQQGPSSRPFHEADWDPEDDEEDDGNVREEAENQTAPKRPRGQPKSNKAATADQPKRRTRRSTAEVLVDEAREFLEGESDDESAEEDASSAPSTSLSRGSPRKAAAAAPAGRKPMTSAEAKAASKRRSRQQRLLVGERGNVFTVDDDDQDESNDPPIRVAANVPKLKQKERRGVNGNGLRNQSEPVTASASGTSKQQKRSRRRQQDKADDNSADELFVAGKQQNADDDAPKAVQVEGFDTVNDDSNNGRFYGQYAALRNIHQVLVGRKYGETPLKKPLKRIHRLCDEIIELLKVLKTQGSDVDEDERVHSETALAKKVSSLQKLATEIDPESSDDALLYAYDVYQCSFPGLTRVFLAHCDFFESRGGLDIDALDDLISLADTVIGLRTRAKKWITKPDAKSNVVQPVINTIVAPLRQIREVFKSNKAMLQRTKQYNDRYQQDCNTHYEKAEEDEIFEEQLAHKNDQIDRLRELYLTRQEVEPDRKRRSLLGLPQRLQTKPRRPNIDANGSVFERINLFGSRAAAAHRRPVELEPAAWSPEQRLDLMEGLERFGGMDRVFSLIIRAYCGRGGSLRDFKVHQLLEEAGALREYVLTAEEEDSSGTIIVPESVRNMPDLDLLEYLVERYAQ